MSVIKPIKVNGIEVKPKNGAYYCPYKCGDPRYPIKKWKTEKGFLKHLEACPKSPDAAARRIEADNLHKAESDAKAKTAMESCLIDIGDTIFYVREIITNPTHVQRGSRLIRVRYEAEKRFVAAKETVESVGFDYSLYVNNGIRISDILGSMDVAEESARKKKAGYDEHCKFSARCR